MTEEYPASYALRIKALDSVTFLVGLALLATPAVLRFYPGDIDTSVHVAIGALMAVPAAFRVLVAYGSGWVEVVLGFLGVLTFLMPRFMHHMTDEPRYAMAHMIAGAVVIAVSIISGLSTWAFLRSRRPASV